MTGQGNANPVLLFFIPYDSNHGWQYVRRAMAYIGSDPYEFDGTFDGPGEPEERALIEAIEAWEEGMAICVNGIPLDIWLANHS
jgi:hypothetical protein